MLHPLFLNLGSGEIFLIVLVIILFFGADKLPEMARMFTKGMNDMKNAAGEIQREIQTQATDIQREMNIQDELDEVKSAASNLTKKISEGLEARAEEKKSEVKQIDSPEPPSTDPDIHPEDSIKR